MLKGSKYNLVISNNADGTLIFNTVSSAMSLFDDKCTELLLSKDHFDLESIDENIQKYVKLMIEHGYIVDSKIDEVEKLNVITTTKRFGSKTLTYTIAPTLDCNMNCPYCYEVKDPTAMNDEVANDFIKFTKEKLKREGFNELYISWYGGEPLLALDTIKKISKELIGFCDENRISYKSTMVTNGLLLDESVGSILKSECRVNGFQVTLDGLKEINNIRRRTKDGSDSFSKIISNIDANVDKFSFSLRINIDKKNFAEMPKFVDYIQNKNNWSNKVQFYFAPIENSTEACSYNTHDCMSHEEFSDFYSDMLNYQFSLNNNLPIQRPRMKAMVCNHISPNVFVIDPYGYLYKCWNLVGLPQHNVGSVIDGEVLNAENIKWLSFKHPEKCVECIKRPVCQGGCPYVIMNSTTEMKCPHQSETFITNLKLIHQKKGACS